LGGSDIRDPMYGLVKVKVKVRVKGKGKGKGKGDF
jgi:hypothetical protein